MKKKKYLSKGSYRAHRFKNGENNAQEIKYNIVFIASNDIATAQRQELQKDF